MPRGEGPQPPGSGGALHRCYEVYDEAVEALEQVRVGVLATWREAAVGPREVEQKVALVR